MTYPLLLEPLVREVVWGGRWLAEQLGRPGTEGARLGESWEAFSGSVVGNGAWKGRTLEQIFAEQKADFAGSAAMRYPKFPLLVKFIDAHENLSIQVHPDDALARQLENYPFGKTEFWYILDAAPDAHIYYGLNASDIRHEELQAAVENHDLLRYLNRVPVRAGDVVYMPAGTVHAITAGIVVYELQQDSDITYRLYDWGRTDREIHLEKGLRAIDPECANMRVTHPHLDESGTADLVCCGFFHSELWRVSAPKEVGGKSAAAREVAGVEDSFSLVTVVSGAGTVFSPESRFEPVEVTTGTTFCIPAGLPYALKCAEASPAGQPFEVVVSRLTAS